VLIRDTTSTVISDRLLHKGEGESEDQGMPRRLREYGVGAQILLDLGIHEMELLSDTDRSLVGLEGYGLRITGQRSVSAGGAKAKSVKEKAE